LDTSPAKAALMDGADYIYRVNDDTVQCTRARAPCRPLR
jgi:hypothetical protein